MKGVNLQWRNVYCVGDARLHETVSPPRERMGATMEVEELLLKRDAAAGTSRTRPLRALARALYSFEPLCSRCVVALVARMRHF